MAQNQTVDMKTWMAFIPMVFGMFMAVLDIQIVASSLSQIQGGLSATQTEINWVQSSYLIAEVIIIPIAGWLTKVFSTRIVFATSAAGFSLMSFACAVAWDLKSMIIFRALQGFWGGIMIPTIFASIFKVFPMHMRPTVSVVIGLIVTAAPAAGPILGGYITNYMSWHYLFLLNIIPGIIVTIATLKLVDFDEPDYSLLNNIDFIGILLIAVSLGSLQYVLEEGVNDNWFQSELIRNLAILAGVSGVALIYRELTAMNPIINLYAFRDLNFSFSCVLSFALGWGLFSAVFLMPVFLSSVKGLDSLQIGQYVAVMGGAQLVSAPLAGFLSKKIDMRIVLFFGLVVFGLGCVLNYNITAESGFDQFFIPQAVRGFAIMFCFIPITTLAFATLPVDEIPTASGLYNLMRNLGGAIGLAITNTYLQVWSKRNYMPFMKHVDDTNPVVQESLSGLEQKFASFDYFSPNFSALKNLWLLAQQQAYIITFNQIFVHLGLLFCLVAIPIIWLKKPSLEQPNAE